MPKPPPKPSEGERDYFQKQDQEKMLRLAAQRKDKATAEAAEELRLAHWMRCAKCGNEMESMPFRGVEIERCPNCGGVYLDSGELETLAGEDKGGVFAGLADLVGIKRNQ
jgi:uncharacterized protein